MTVPADLQPGDCLLYGPKGFFGWAIRIHTGHSIAHVEVFVGYDPAESVASRDGKGVGLYPLRIDGLKAVYRPREPFNLGAALRWFKQLPPIPYGWADLLNFIDINVDAKGIVCSPFAAEFYRAGGLDPFNGEPSNKIMPFQFAVSNSFRKVEADEVAARQAV